MRWLREECLNRELLYTLTEARIVIEDWRWKYNNIRPHRSLGYIKPLKFVEQQIQQAEHNNLPERCIGSVRAMPSLRRSSDFLYNKKHKNMRQDERKHWHSLGNSIKSLFKKKRQVASPAASLVTMN